MFRARVLGFSGSAKGHALLAPKIVATARLFYQECNSFFSCISLFIYIYNFVFKECFEHLYLIPVHTWDLNATGWLLNWEFQKYLETKKIIWHISWIKLCFASVYLWTTVLHSAHPSHGAGRIYVDLNLRGAPCDGLCVVCVGLLVVVVVVVGGGGA